MGRINRLIPTTTLTANSVIAMDAESGGATNKVTIQTLAAGLRSFGDYATQTDLNAKQDVLTFDDAPEEDSENPVTSGGINNAIGSAMSNVYTKAETDNAIAQSTAIERVTLNASSMTFESPLSLYQANTVEKTGNICVVRFSIKISSATVGRNYSITNYLPAGMRPYVGHAVSCIGDTGLGDGKAQPLVLDANGVLSIWPVNLNKVTYCIGTVAFVRS